VTQGALTAVKLVSVPASAVRAALSRHADAMEALLLQADHRERAMNQLLGDQVLKRAEARIIKALLILAEERGELVGSDYVFRLDVTQEDLAKMLGIQRATFNRLLGQLDGLGLLSRTVNHVIVLDRQGLAARMKAK